MAASDLNLSGTAGEPIWAMLDGKEPARIGLRLDCGDGGAVYLTDEQAFDTAVVLLDLLQERRAEEARKKGTTVLGSEPQTTSKTIDLSNPGYVPKVEGPWRVEELDASHPRYHRWRVCDKSFDGPTLFASRGFTRKDADDLASAINAREAVAKPKPRYVAQVTPGLSTWEVWDSKLHRHVMMISTIHPDGPETAARAEADRLNAAEGKK